MRRSRRHHKTSNRFNYKHRKFNNHKPRHSFISRVFYNSNKFVKKHPVLSAITSLFGSIVLARLAFSKTLFGWTNTEFKLWFLLVALILFLVCVFSLVAWWRNNVVTRNTKHAINWKNR